MRTTVTGPNQARTLRCDQRGFTLLEALIAMVILSFGLLGLAGMQIMALSFNVDAKELGVAANNAAEMLERIHYNRQNVTAYNGIDTTMTSPTDCPNAQAGQTTALGDCLQWQAGLNNSGLSSVQGLVTVAATGPVALSQNQVVVRVNWMTKQVGGTLGGQGRKRERMATVVLQTVVSPP